MIALGVDPGTARTGYGVVRQEGARLEPVTYGVIRTKSDEPMGQRLLAIYRPLRRLIDETGPDLISVEAIYFNQNAQSAMAVGQARGVVLLAAAAAQLTVREPSPPQVKQAVTGSGRAEKGQVQRMVQRLLRLEETPPADAADALACALFALHGHSLAELAGYL